MIVTLVYYRCPMLCGEELKGLARSLKPLSMTVGDQFDIVTVSIDPDETPELAAGEEGDDPRLLRPARGRRRAGTS